MGKIIRGIMPLVALAGWLSAAPMDAADTADALKKLKELNAITGTEALRGALKIYVDDKELAKQVIAVALPMAKDKKETLSYNAALVLGLMSAELKDMAKSEAFFQACMEKAAKLQSQRKLEQSYETLINLYYQNKKYEDSARICQQLLELKTDDDKPRIVLRAVPTKFGVDFIEEESFDAAQEIRPGVHRFLIKAIAKQGQYDKALKLVGNLLKKKDHWLYRELQAWVLHEAGKYGEAAKVYEDIIEQVTKEPKLDPEEKEAYVEMYRSALSNVFLDMGNVKLAADQLQTLLSKKPDFPQYNNDLGYIWADNGMNLDEAEKMIRKALDLDRKIRQAAPNFDPDKDRDNGAYLDSLGWVLFKQKKYEEAKKYLLEAVKDEARQHIEIFDHLGDVYLALGDKAEAVMAWRKGLEHVTESRRDLERKTIVEKKIEQNK